MDSFNFNNLVEPIDFNYDTGVFKDGPFSSSIKVPDLSGVLTDPDVFGTGGYIPEPGFTYGNVFGDAGGTGAKKSGGFLDTLIGSVENLFGGGSLPADPYAGSEVSRSFGRPRSSYVGNTQQRMNSLLANAIDSFKEPRSVI